MTTTTTATETTREFPKRSNLIVFDKTGNELCIPCIIDVQEVNPITAQVPENPKFRIKSLDIRKKHGAALEFYFKPSLQHTNHPDFFKHFIKKLPNHILVPATYRNARADNREGVYNLPLAAGWLRVSTDGKLYLERDGEPTKQVSPRNVSESVISIATKIQELYEEVTKDH
ncbi:hypothetical protein GF369_00695 [Candidatus Peregrinibacteria bacterium]|nr:hypothetical protein [Candidatus Peregrinibacteria bacterium]